MFCVQNLVLKQKKPPQVPMGGQQQPPLMQMQNNLPANWNNKSAGVNSNLASQIDAINAQQLTLQEQIRQSEQNLTAQQSVSKWSKSNIYLLLVLFEIREPELYRFDFHFVHF